MGSIDAERLRRRIWCDSFGKEFELIAPTECFSDLNGSLDADSDTRGILVSAGIDHPTKRHGPAPRRGDHACKRVDRKEGVVRRKARIGVFDLVRVNRSDVRAD